MPPVPETQVAKVPTVAPLTVGVRETAAMLGVSKPSVYKLVKDRKLTAVRLCGRTLIKYDDIVNLVAEAAA